MADTTTTTTTDPTTTPTPNYSTLDYSSSTVTTTTDANGTVTGNTSNSVEGFIKQPFEGTSIQLPSATIYIEYRTDLGSLLIAVFLFTLICIQSFRWVSDTYRERKGS